MNNKKKNLIVILLALTCLFVVVIGSLAYESRSVTARNIITTGKIDIEVNEYADEKGTPFPENGVSGVMPGATVTKIVEVENTGDSPAWVRIKVDKLIRLAEGVEGEPDASLILLDINEDYWTLVDGWYYYNAELPAGEKTGAPLFTQVTFDRNMQNMYQNSTAEVAVIAQAVQAKNNNSKKLAYEAEGWPELTGTGGDKA